MTQPLGFSLGLSGRGQSLLGVEVTLTFDPAGEAVTINFNANPPAQQFDAQGETVNLEF